MSVNNTEDTAKPLRIGLALGGGGARGWAHIGVIRALQAAGLQPDVVAGTSMGAAVGAAYAAGTLDAFEAWARRLDRRTLLSLFDVSFRGGLIGANRVFDELQDILPEIDIEQLGMPFAAVATDLERGTAVRIRRGSLQDAVRASIAIPGLISPARKDGRWMVDGGLSDPVPVSAARALGADAVVAVELSASLALSPALASLAKSGVAKPAAAENDHDGSEPVSLGALDREVGPGPRSSKSSWDVFDTLSDMAERLLGQRRSITDEASRREPSVYEVISQSLYFMQVRITRSIMAGDPPELHVVPRLQNVGLMDFDRASEAIDEGFRAVQVALAVQADFRRPELGDRSDSSA